jgi:tetratricopeptide (TPR) repeat protein
MQTSLANRQFFEIWADKAVEQWRILLGIAIAVLVAVAVAGLVGSIKSKKEIAATNALYEAQTAAHKAVAEKKYDQAEGVLNAMIQAHPGTRGAFEAELQLGDIWMEAANFDKAAAAYQHAASESSDPFSKLLATYSVGVAHESAGKLDQAVKSYEEALGMSGSDFLKPELLMAEARCLEGLKQNQKAIEIYKQVQEKFSTRAYYSGAASAFEKQLAAEGAAK